MFLAIVFLVLLTKLFVMVVLNPLVKQKIESKVNEKIPGYHVEIQKVNISIISPGIELNNLLFVPVQDSLDASGFTGEVGTLSIRGVNLMKLLFKSSIDIFKIEIANADIKGKIPFRKESTPAPISLFNIRIAEVYLNNVNIDVHNTLNAQSFSMKEGCFNMKGLQVEKQDSLSPKLLQPFDLKVKMLSSVSSNGMYTFSVRELHNSSASQMLSIDSFLIQPNYTAYEFTSRYKYQTDRIDGEITDLKLYDFKAENYFTDSVFSASYLEIGQMDIDVFRDKQEEFQHVDKLPFQELIYNFPGILNIDSLAIINGDVIYSEHAENSEEAGKISFNDLQVKIYKITNDSAYKEREAFFELQAEALVMNAGRLSISIKAPLFDRNNTFKVKGSLAGMEVAKLNPMLTNNAFVEAKSGVIESMNFSFTADNTAAAGSLKILYNNLKIEVLDKQSETSSSLKGWLRSLIANMIILESNPLPNEEAREGTIEYKRDPERFLFNYAFKSILTGLKQSLGRASKRKRKE